MAIRFASGPLDWQHHHLTVEPADDAAIAAAITHMAHASCCGHGGGQTELAKGDRKPHRFERLGKARWLSTLGKASAALRWIEGPYVLPDVTVEQPKRERLAHVDVLIEAGRISAITASDEGNFGAVKRLEAVRGHIVAPALTDMHVHMPLDNVLGLTPLFLLLTLRHGIVRARDAGDPDGSATPAALALSASGAFPPFDLHYAYSFVGIGRKRWMNTLDVSAPGATEAAVDILARVGATWVKAYENLDRERIAALVAAAAKSGLQVMGHVPTPLRLEEAGLPEPQHYFGVPEPATLRRDHVLNRAIDWSSVDEERIDRVVEASVTQGIAMTPTLTMSRSLLRLQHWQEERRKPDAKLLPGFFADVIWHPHHGLPAYRDMSADDFSRARDAYVRKLALTRKLFDAGVPLFLGTDTQQPFVVPGASLHAEIEAFEDAGIAREDAWERASVAAAERLGVFDSGRIEVGRRADLIVSPKSPLGREWSPHRISATVSNGAFMLGDDLDAAIAGELRRFDSRLRNHVSAFLAKVAMQKTARAFVS